MGALASALFGKTRQGVLALLYGHPDESFYLREIARSIGDGVGSVQRELENLEQAGLIERSTRGKHVFYQANRSAPIFPELHGLIVKTCGVADVLRAALQPLAASIRVAFIFGSVARGEVRRRSDVDVLVVGEADFGDVVAAIHPPEEKLRREVSPVVYGEAEFRDKVTAEHYFLATVLGEPKIFLVGGEDELRKLVGRGLDSRTSTEP